MATDNRCMRWGIGVVSVTYLCHKQIKKKGEAQPLTIKH